MLHKIKDYKLKTGNISVKPKVFENQPDLTGNRILKSEVFLNDTIDTNKTYLHRLNVDNLILVPLQEKK